MKRLTIVLATILSLFILCAHPVEGKETWTSIRSKNFFLIGNASEKEIRQVASKLEQFREVFSRVFTGIKFNSTVPTTVVVFKSDSSYRPFKNNPNSAGYFQPGPDVNYITLTTEVRGEQDPFSVIFHEYTHLLVNNTTGNVPTWFNEGLAEYYSTFTITDDLKVMLGKPIGNHVYLLRESKMLPLRTLFQVDHKSPYYNERDKQSIFYAESWALMHYLILGNDGQRLVPLNTFLKLVEANVPMEKAFEQAFQTSFEKMEKELREYIKRDRYPVVNGHFERKLDFDTEMEAAPLTDAEAQAYLGDLLLHSNRSESEKYLQKALALDPNLAMANASMGMLRVREGKIDEARQSLERAVAANLQNYLIHYYYAFALSRIGMDNREMVSGYAPETVSKIREQLQKAIDLRPDYPESYKLLAFVNLVNGSQLDETIALLKHALTTSPGRNDLLFMLAQVYLHKEDYKTARQLLERLSQNNSDPDIRQEAQAMLAELTAQEQRIAEYRAASERTLSNPAAAADDNSPLRRRNNVASQAEAETKVIEKPDPSSYLREALRKPGDGEKQVQGMLLRIDCDAKGIIFVVQLDDRILKVRAVNFESLEIVAFVTGLGDQITCGSRKPVNPVVVCYVPSNDARLKIDGTAKSVEFVPGDFKLKR